MFVGQQFTRAIFLKIVCRNFDHDERNDSQTDGEGNRKQEETNQNVLPGDCSENIHFPLPVLYLISRRTSNKDSSSCLITSSATIGSLKSASSATCQNSSSPLAPARSNA